VRRGRSHPRSGFASRTAASSCSPRAARRNGPASGSRRRRRRRRSSPTSGPTRSRSTRRGCGRSSPRALAGIGRAHANEILWRAGLSPFALSTQLDEEEVDRLAHTIREDLERALELRLAGKGDKDVYVVHRRLGEPCPRGHDADSGGPIHQVDYEEHTVFYCPACQTGGRVLKDRRLSRLLR
jgi:formamidopyrimidine-DNA glycosylase